MTRISKIARLPHQIREQLNLRLHNGELGRTILPWVNELPETKKVMQQLTRKFASLQNAYNWSRRVQLEFDKFQAEYPIEEPDESEAPENPPTTNLRTVNGAQSIALRDDLAATGGAMLRAPIQGENSPQLVAPIEPLNRQNSQRSPSPSPPRSGGEGRGEVVLRVQGEEPINLHAEETETEINQPEPPTLGAPASRWQDSTPTSVIDCNDAPLSEVEPPKPAAFQPIPIPAPTPPKPTMPRTHLAPPNLISHPSPSAAADSHASKVNQLDNSKHEPRN